MDLDEHLRSNLSEFSELINLVLQDKWLIFKFLLVFITSNISKTIIFLKSEKHL